MLWNDHSKYEGKHSLLSPSKYHWLYDTAESFEERYCTSFAAEMGTTLHDIARKHIKHGFRLSKNDKKSVMLELIDAGIPKRITNYVDYDLIFDTLMSYTNDGILYKMKPEVLLMYNEDCFGTCDSISFDENKGELRIHDLKTGKQIAKMEQLYVYAALFFLDYKVYKPYETKTILRIYQNGLVNEELTDPSLINNTINIIKSRSQSINDIKKE